MLFKYYFNNKHSKSIALDRLKVLLISDRVDCNPDIMDMLREDITKVISKYLEIDPEAVNVQIKKTMIKDKGSYQARLCANAPIKSVSNISTVKS